jgi:GT2 family glycosyltransferase
VAIECIVVEQSDRPELSGQLPPWVRHVHTPLPSPHMPYCRAWALNVGARLARGGILVLHDNDMLVPERLCAELCALFDKGYEVINLKRFIFYLSERDTEAMMCSGSGNGRLRPEVVVQNLEGGGSVAIGREPFFRIGGVDEAFVGWGGEDNEFWERAHTTQVWPYGYLPIVHLWHPAQPGKFDAANPTLALYKVRSAIPVEERIRELAGRAFGNPFRRSE